MQSCSASLVLKYMQVETNINLYLCIFFTFGISQFHFVFVHMQVETNINLYLCIFFFWYFSICILYLCTCRWKQS